MNNIITRTITFWLTQISIIIEHAVFVNFAKTVFLGRMIKRKFREEIVHYFLDALQVVTIF
ncbi:hypothetical protein [Spirosoma knui]